MTDAVRLTTDDDRRRPATDDDRRRATTTTADDDGRRRTTADVGGRRRTATEDGDGGQGHTKAKPSSYVYQWRDEQPFISLRSFKQTLFFLRKTNERVIASFKSTKKQKDKTDKTIIFFLMVFR